MQSIIQILKLNDARSGEKNGRKWEMQDAECLLLNEDGTVNQVGVLMLPKDLMGKVQPGTFMGTFALRADTSREGQRRINAILTGLQPIDQRKPAATTARSAA
ncbi:MAG: hypothetical protein ACOVS5_07975 [Oligoflexus sp.]